MPPTACSPSSPSSQSSPGEPTRDFLQSHAFSRWGEAQAHPPAPALPAGRAETVPPAGRASGDTAWEAGAWAAGILLVLASTLTLAPLAGGWPAPAAPGVRAGGGYAQAAAHADPEGGTPGCRAERAGVPPPGLGDAPERGEGPEAEEAALLLYVPACVHASDEGDWMRDTRRLSKAI